MFFATPGFLTPTPYLTHMVAQQQLIAFFNYQVQLQIR
jgi:hypothetical protein